MAILEKLTSSLLFWAAWIVIPLLMEIIPSVGSALVLLRHRIHRHPIQAPALYPEISVIIPVYNSADTLEECIRSLYESDYPTQRIRAFLVNNQGTDDSFSVFAACQQKYPDLRMQWLNAEQGKSRALNLALYNSGGKYIIHIDSDGVLEPSALRRMVEKFEEHPTINCMTGAILTRGDHIEPRRGLLRFLQRLEFLEYAQAFLAGRNYAAGNNNIYTLSGAFSAFRKSAIPKSRMYSTETVSEDTQITFQMRYLQHERIDVSEDSIFFVDPIESVDKLYTQRQRWQRGSLEVSRMFIANKLKGREFFRDVNVRTLMYDHTFSFPRLMWYLALFWLWDRGRYPGKIRYVVLAILLGFALDGFLLVPSLVGGITTKDSTDIMALFFQTLNESIDPFWGHELGGGWSRWDHSASAYFGLAAFVLTIFGGILSRRQLRPGFWASLTICLMTTTAMYPLISMLPGSQYLWMTRFVSIALALLLVCFFRWVTLKKRWQRLFVVLLAVECIPALTLMTGKWDASTPEERLAVRIQRSLADKGRALTIQRMSMAEPNGGSAPRARSSTTPAPCGPAMARASRGRRTTPTSFRSTRPPRTDSSSTPLIGCWRWATTP